MGKRTLTNMPSAPYANSYINCTVAQTQSGSIDQSRYGYETSLTTKILNARNLTAAEKVKFLQLLETLK